jgi:hypothetical protein
MDSIWIRLAIAAVLVFSVGYSWFGRPPKHAPRFAFVLLSLALVIMVWLMASAAINGDLSQLAVTLAGGVECLCGLVWFARGRVDGHDDDDRGGDIGPEPDPAGPSPVDWEQFDRERDSWQKRPTPASRPLVKV